MVNERRLVQLFGQVPLCLVLVWPLAGCNGSRGVEVKTYWGPIVKYSDFGPTFGWVDGAGDPRSAVRDTDNSALPRHPRS